MSPAEFPVIGPAGPIGPVGPGGPASNVKLDADSGSANVRGEFAIVGSGVLISRVTDQGGGSALVTLTVPPVAGPQGVQGIQGPSGAVGATGPPGTAGAPGATGATGPQGASGASGAQGIQGPQGIQGAQGAQGDTGLTGPTGPTGSTGPTGASGAPGATGAQGASGAQGIQGPAGASGAPGAQGATGATGASGAPGAQGPAGPQGAQGVSGVASFVASAGNSSAVVGPFLGIAASGNASAQLSQAGGSAVVTLTVFPTPGPAGPAGAAGADGAPGTPGATGATGAQGPGGVAPDYGPQTSALAIASGAQQTALAWVEGQIALDEAMLGILSSGAAIQPIIASGWVASAGVNLTYQSASGFGIPGQALIYTGSGNSAVQADDPNVRLGFPHSAESAYAQASGIIFESYPRMFAVAGIAATSGRAEGAMIVMPAGFPVHDIWNMYQGSASAPTHQFAILTDYNGNMLAVSPDLGTQPLAAGQMRAYPVRGPNGQLYTTTYTGVYYAWWMCGAATPQALWGYNSSPGTGTPAGIAKPFISVILNGATMGGPPPAFPFTMPAFGAFQFQPWFGIS